MPKERLIMQNERYYSIQDNGAEDGIIIFPSRYILKLKPNEAIAELEAYISSIKEILGKTKSEDNEMYQNIEKYKQLRFDLMIVENFFFHLKRGSAPKILKYLDFEKDDIDWLALGPEMFGEKEFDEIIRQASNDIGGQRNFDDTEALEALEVYLESIRINPNDAKAHYNLGLAYSKRGENIEAIKEFKQAIKIEPNYTDAHYSLGLTYGNLGRFK